MHHSLKGGERGMRGRDGHIDKNETQNGSSKRCRHFFLISDADIYTSTGKEEQREGKLNTAGKNIEKGDCVRTIVSM